MTTPRIFILALLTPLGIIAQNKIEGKIINDKNEGVSFCALALLRSSDSSLVKGNISADDGNFIFENVPKGSYLLKAAAVGYNEFISPAIAIDSAAHLTLEPLMMTSSAVNLKEVSVSTFKPTIEFKKGTIILNAENDLVARGNTVLDLLKRLPGVIVDPQNNISINGNSNVRFLMDGRLQNIPASQMVTILSGMSAETIKSLELIKNPPARYDAAGMAGLINIVTKRATLKGLSGFINESASQGKRAREMTVLGLNYKNNKLSLFSNVNLQEYTWEDETELDRVLNTTATTNAFDASGTIVRPGQTLNANAGIEYEFTPKTSAGIYLNENLSIFNPVQNARTQVKEGDAFNYNTFVYHTDHKNNYNSPTLSASLLHKLDSAGSQIQYQGDYTDITGAENKVINNHFYDINGNESVAPSSYITNIQGDYKISNHRLDLTQQFKRQLTLEAGVKAGLADLSHNVNLQLQNTSAGFFIGDTTFENNYRYKEQILAAYATLSKTIKDLSLSAGLRAEHTNIDAKNLSSGYTLGRNYLNFFPSGSVDLKLNKKNSLTTSYSYRIDRPSYEMMNPIRVFNDQLNYSVGNSELKPQYTHYITMDHNYGGFMTTSIGYNRTNDFTFYYTYTKPNSQVNIDTIFNFPKRNQFILSEYIQGQVKWFSAQLYAHILYRNFRGTIEGENADSDTYQYYASLNMDFALPKKFKITVNSYYNSKFYDGIQTYYPTSSVSLMINKLLFNDKLSITLGIFDIFWKDYGSHSSRLSDQYYYYRQKPDSRRVRLNITWKFGKIRIEQKLNHESDIRLKGR